MYLLQTVTTVLNVCPSPNLQLRSISKMFVFINLYYISHFDLTAWPYSGNQLHNLSCYPGIQSHSSVVCCPNHTLLCQKNPHLPLISRPTLNSFQVPPLWMCCFLSSPCPNLELNQGPSEHINNFLPQRIVTCRSTKAAALTGQGKQLQCLRVSDVTD